EGSRSISTRPTAVTSSMWTVITTSTSPWVTPGRWRDTHRRPPPRRGPNGAGPGGGTTTMPPTEDAEWVAAELTRRFGLPQWSFTLSATDANRWALRLARLVTGRSKILVFSHCYHGSVDETFVVVGPDGHALSRPGNVGPPVDP